MRSLRVRRSLLGISLILGATTSVPGQDVPRFVDITKEIGLAYLGPVYTAAAADFDRDGWVDLAVSNHGHLRLFRNRQGGGFAEPFEPTLATPGDTHGISWIDLDGDGWLDLYVSVGAARGFGQGSNRLYQNLEGSGFEWRQDLTEEWADPLGRGRCSLPWDSDGDGSVEILILNQADENRPHRWLHRSADGWIDRAAEHGLSRVRAECMMALHLTGVSTYVAYGSGPDSGRLYRLDERGRMRDVTEELGVKPQGTVFAVATGDYDNDGDTDLYFVQGHGIPAAATVSGRTLEFRLVDDDLHNDPSVRIRTRGRLTIDLDLAGRGDPARIRFGRKGLHPEGLPWQIEALDADLEGRPLVEGVDEASLLVWRQGEDAIHFELVGADARFRAASGRVHTTEALELLQGPTVTPRPQPNRLLENRGTALIDVSSVTGSDDPRSGRDAVFFDMDNDGDLDLFVANGGTAFVNQPDVLLQNNGDKTFSEVTELAGVAGMTEGRGASVLAADFDNDGDLDLFTTNGDGPSLGNRGPYVFYRNTSKPAGHAQLDLLGADGNRFAMGAQVTFRFGDHQQHSQRTATNQRFSTSVLPFHLGMRSANKAQVEVLFADGERQTLTISAGDRISLGQSTRPTAN